MESFTVSANEHDFCCPGLTDVRRRMEDHASEGPSHGVTQARIDDIREDVLALKLTVETNHGQMRLQMEDLDEKLTAKIHEVETGMHQNQLKLYAVMGGVSVLTSVLSILGPDRLGKVFTEVARLFVV
jgi:hypothetical protein